MFRNYYREPDVLDNDFHCADVPLQVNCAGHEAHADRFLVRHTRRDTYLFYLCEGTVEVHLPTAATLHAGDMILFPARVPFSYTYAGGQTAVHLFAHFTGYAVGDLLRAAHLPEGEVVHVGHPDLVTERFDALFRAFVRRDALFDLDCAGRLTTLLVTLGRLSTEAAALPRRLDASLSHIHRHLAEPLSVRRLAELEFVSESRYRALFSSLLHMSPTAYVNAQRMRAASELLAHTELPVGAIGASVGYGDPRYFSRVFHRHTGLTPTAYRERARADESDGL